MVRAIVQLYLNRAFSVIPIETIDSRLHNPDKTKFDKNKKSIILWEPFQKRHASLEEVESWDDKNVAIVTGEISGVVVLDVDGEEGRKSLESLGPLPRTPTVKSYRGHHYYFKHPGARVTSRSGVLPGIDIKGDGGYAVAPPSVHESGTQYVWVDGASLDDAPLAELPENIRRLVVREEPVFSSSVVFNPNDLIRAQKALPFIPADDRQTWITVGMALHDETSGGDEGYRIWTEWSRTCPAKFDEKVQKRQYRSFKPDKSNRVTLASVFKLARAGGWHEAREFPQASYYRLQKPSIETRMVTRREVGDVTVRAMAAINRRFQKYSHHPSKQHMDGLEQIALTIQAMANRDRALVSDIFISFVPPGIGKSTTLVEAVRLSPKNVGVVIFLSRCEEIKKLVEAMGLSNEEFSVIVSDNYPKIASLGNQDRTKARVLFTTQQMLESRTEGGRLFRDVQEFYFRGAARPIRVWDESISPSTIYTLGRYDISHLLKTCQENGHSALADTLDKLSDTVKTTKDGAVVSVPDDLGVGLNEMKSWYDNESDRNACEALFDLKGRESRVRRDLGGNAILDYKDKLPEDLGPMLVLDASGAHRSVYQHWHDHRKGLRFLPSPQKLYTGQTIHAWDRGSGKASWAQNKTEWLDILRGIVKVIETIPKYEEVLVVHFKPSPMIIDVEKELREKVDCSNVSFLTWGKHTATNEFQECKHVILASVLQYSVPQTEALARSATKLSVKNELSKQDYESTRLGEIAHNILQAACRGQVRKCINGTCPDGCHLYVVFSSYKATGIPREMLNDIFPGAAIEDWAPVIRLTGKKQKALAACLTQAWLDGKRAINKGDLIEQLGLRDGYYLNRVLDDTNVVEYLTAKAITYRHDDQSVILKRGLIDPLNQLDDINLPPLVFDRPRLRLWHQWLPFGKARSLRSLTYPALFEEAPKSLYISPLMEFWGIMPTDGLDRSVKIVEHHIKPSADSLVWGTGQSELYRPLR
jgi:Bifunctional DNA primase/polymerase, N-terminal/Primase C terminal 2 (PriCT-2)